MRRIVAGKIMHLEHSPERMDFLDNFQAVGGKVWPASDLMIKYRVITQRRLEHDMEGMLIECEMEPDRMLLDICDLNISRNQAICGNSHLKTQELEWGEENFSHIDRICNDDPYDVIIGSDVTYHANLSEDLFWTVSTLLRRHRALSQRRSADGIENGNNRKEIAFLVSHQFRLESATALTLSTAKRFGLHCITLATSSNTAVKVMAQQPPSKIITRQATVLSADPRPTSVSSQIDLTSTNIPIQMTELGAGVGASNDIYTMQLPTEVEVGVDWMCGGNSTSTNIMNDVRGVRTYLNDSGVSGEFALWRFTLQSDRPCGLQWE